MKCSVKVIMNGGLDRTDDKVACYTLSHDRGISLETLKITTRNLDLPKETRTRYVLNTCETFNVTA
jgi:hypothetical protein